MSLFSQSHSCCFCPGQRVFVDPRLYIWCYNLWGLRHKSLYSSLKARDKTWIGCPSPSVTDIPPGSKWIWALTLVNKSRPSRGAGHSGITKNEWDTWWVPRFTFRSVVQQYLFVPVAPCTKLVFLEIGPSFLFKTECWAPVSTMKPTGFPPHVWLPRTQGGVPSLDSPSQSSPAYRTRVPGGIPSLWVVPLLGSLLGHGFFQCPCSLQ